MLGTAKLVAFLATADAARARDFYESRLGLRVIADDAFALVLDCGGTQLRIQKVEAVTPQPHTALGWSVDALDRTVDALRARGIAFERYPFLEMDARDIWTAPSGARIVWFKDPDGHLLSLTEMRG